VTLVFCCLRLQGRLCEKVVFLSGINGSKRVARMWKMMKDLIVQDLTEPLKMWKKCGICCTQIFKYQEL
jgi:hypothetical protein